MHDLIHNLAQLAVKSEIFILTDDVQNMSERVHHVSFDEWSPKMKVLKAKPIRTLFMLSKDYFHCGDNVDSIVNTLIPNCKCLRVLDLSCLIRGELPKSLVKLVHLRYLDLSCRGMRVLPSGITSLQNLQTLKLSKCDDLKELPRNIRKMINLRYLEIDGCQRLDYMPCRLGELTMLQTLPLFVIGKGDREGIGRLNELQCLNNLRGGLHIRNLQRVKGGALESKEANLKEKHYLQSLALQWRWWEWGEDYQKGEDAELVMEGLQPCPNLKELYIDGYTGVRFPSWMSSVLPSLQRLYLTHLNALEYVLENSSSAEPFFPSLKTLKLGGLRNLKEWCRREIAGERAPSFPSLSELQIYWCDQLTTFQLLSSPLLTLLQVEYCGGLTSLQLLSSPRLFKLLIFNCRSLESLQLPSCPSLSQLWIVAWNPCNCLLYLVLRN
ncbi:putative disease resistance protein RGA3 isoform X2 [Vitis riparia]|uniref:putative disease resistance protein RGA3 isoform X2 n=1 Tax=Vitis riparia TaxID=96939 RepID=UPI00155AE64F|nr:putative disease resistance protein RGA3 isoform X2 [Vitis riparia]